MGFVEECQTPLTGSDNLRLVPARLVSVARLAASHARRPSPRARRAASRSCGCTSQTGAVRGAKQVGNTKAQKDSLEQQRAPHPRAMSGLRWTLETLTSLPRRGKGAQLAPERSHRPRHHSRTVPCAASTCDMAVAAAKAALSPATAAARSLTVSGWSQSPAAPAPPYATYSALRSGSVVRAFRTPQ